MIITESEKYYGLVISQTNYNEADRIIRIFTKQAGIITVIVKGARKYKSHQAAASQLLSLGSFNLVKGRNMYTLRGASCDTTFFKISESIEKLALCQYFFDLTYSLLSDENPDEEVFSLLLNSVYILANKDRPLKNIKAAFEVRLCALCGEELLLGECVKCGNGENLSSFSLKLGGMLCDKCRSGDAVTLSRASALALDFLQVCPKEKLFSAEINGSAASEVSSIAEKHALLMSEREFKSLKYFNNIAK